MARNLCLFAHFDALNRVEPYVLRYVEAIHSCGFEVVFISTAMIPDTDCAALLRFCREVIGRPNTGLDFASWATGFAKYGHDLEGELLLANDSVYGPIGRLDDALSRLRALPGDVRGMVESLESEQHLQSWFILLSPNAHRSAAFREIMAQDFANLTKGEIIAKGEIVLSSRLRVAGLTSAALFSMAHRVHDGAIAHYSPSHLLWKELIEIFGIPFIKVELLRENPHSVSNLSQWRVVLGTRAPELIPLVEAHLSQSRRRNAGERGIVRLFFVLMREALVRRDLRLDQSGKRIRRRLNRHIFNTARAIIKSISS
jgi:lipopolysaccharide biosynthesis protein